MRRGYGWIVAILGVLLLVGVVFGAYNWGVSEGLERSGEATEVVRYVGHGWGFPFGFLFFPLFFLLLLLFAFKGFGWRRGWGHDGNGEHGPGGPGGPGRQRWEQHFEDWHRRQHEVGGSHGAGGEPA
jgi:hypothetical protein